MVWNWNYVHNSKKVELIPELGPKISSHSNFGGTPRSYSQFRRCLSTAITINTTSTIEVSTMGLKFCGTSPSRSAIMRHFSPTTQRFGSRNITVLLLFGDVIGGVCPSTSGALAADCGNSLGVVIYFLHRIWVMDARKFLFLKLALHLLAPYQKTGETLAKFSW